MEFTISRLSFSRVLFAIISLPLLQCLVSRYDDAERTGTNNRGLARLHSTCSGEMYQSDSTLLAKLESRELLEHSRSHPIILYQPVLRTSRVANSIHEVITRQKVLRGGHEAAGNSKLLSTTTLANSRVLSSIKSIMIHLPLCLSALGISISTMFAYFLTAVYIFKWLEAWHGHELAPNTIASVSLTASLLASSATCGAFLGRVATSYPTRQAAVVGTAFMLLQLWQLDFFQGIPIWLTILTIVSYTPCCVHAASRAARRYSIGFAESAPAAPDAATAPAAPAEPLLPPAEATAPDADATLDAPGELVGDAGDAGDATLPESDRQTAVAGQPPGGGGDNPVLGWLRGRFSAVRDGPR